MRSVGATVAALALLAPLSAAAQGNSFADLGSGLAPDQDAAVDVTGALRLRAASLYNLDLDRGLDPSGRPLFPTPITDPNSQLVTHADMRLRTDVSLYAPFGASRVTARIDVLDNVTLGSNANLTPVTTTSQLSPDRRAFQIKRAYGEALTPFGVVAAGRMGNTWGLGILANGGDCPDCDSGDAADRLAFVSTAFDHFVAVAYDIAWVGRTADRRVDTRELNLDPGDDVQSITFAALRYRDDDALVRRMKADRLTFDYGVSYSFRWQTDDIPVDYIGAGGQPQLDEGQVVRRDFSASVLDGWARLVGPTMRIEAEVAYLRAYIGEGSVIPGVRYGLPLTSDQWGAALESDFGAPTDWFSAGLDMGIASGDAAYGFGVDTGGIDLEQPQPQPGDLDGPQANPPYDRRVDNFRFNPDYRVDKIMFREIIGTVTDAVYVRPHMRVDLWKAAPGRLRFDAAAIYAQALYSTSTPGGEAPLGLEIDPSLEYVSRDGFGATLDYAVLFPLAGFDNVADGLPAQPAQLLRLRLTYGF